MSTTDALPFVAASAAPLPSGAATSPNTPNSPTGPGTDTTGCSGVSCLQHILVVMLENQSGDRVLGQFSNGNSVDGPVVGLPTDTAGHFTTCLVDPRQDTLSAGTSPTPTPWPCLQPYSVPWPPPTATPTPVCSLCPPPPTPTFQQQDNPHSAAFAATDVAGVPAYGSDVPTPMSGFVASAWSWCQTPNVDTAGYAATNPACATPAPGQDPRTLAPFDVLRYLTAPEIPTYWYYLQYYTVQDHLFVPVASYSLPSHLFQVSGWSATCPMSGTPTTCTNELANPQNIVNQPGSTPAPNQAYPNYAWTDITYLLDHHQLLEANGVPVPTTTSTSGFCGTDPQGTSTYFNPLETPIATPVGAACQRAPVSWKYYIADNTKADCPGFTDPCHPVQQLANGTVEFWNPLQFFTTVHADGTPGPGIPTPLPGTVGQTSNIQFYKQFAQDAANGTLPSVAWLAPDVLHSDHPPYAIIDGGPYGDNGETLLQWVIKTLSSGPSDQWQHTAVLVAWDDWGGFYDHVLPPPTATPNPSGVSANGYGVRVPGIIISPYVKHCYVDRQVLSFDAYNRLIEDDFLNGQRLDGPTDGRPDPRATWEPTPRETALAGDLQNDFDFTRTVFPTPVVTPLPLATPGNVYPTPTSGWCS